MTTGKTKALTIWTFVGKVMSLLFNMLSAAAAAKSLQSCLTLCDPTDSSPPGSTIPGILYARTLEWVAISFSNAWKWIVKMKSLSRVRFFVIPWTVVYQAPQSMVFSSQEYWSGLPFPSPGDLPNPGIEPGSPTLQADALPSEPPGKPSLPRDKHLLISWLQIPSAVIWEPPKIVSHCFHCFPIYPPWSDGTGCHDLSFLNVEC